MQGLGNLFAIQALSDDPSGATGVLVWMAHQAGRNDEMLEERGCAMDVIVSGLAIAATLVVASSRLSAAESVQAGVDKYHITAEERAACSMDAAELCSAAYPDESKLLSCMKINRVSLSASCRPVFEEGIRRRHLN